tara:strand:- start:290 stop:559 length:270 start_codon:yes stop_codon:yes gene_type:complete
MKNLQVMENFEFAVNDYAALKHELDKYRTTIVETGSAKQLSEFDSVIKRVTTIESDTPNNWPATAILGLLVLLVPWVWGLWSMIYNFLH